MIDDLHQRVQTIIGGLSGARDLTVFSKQYHQQFAQSGIEKAKGIITNLKSRTSVNLSTCAYLSVGGSEGSEIATVMAETPIRYGILLEYDSDVISRVISHQDHLRPDGKTLEMEIGDVMQRILSCSNRLKKWRSEGLIEGVICSAQAVFHEFPTRSPDFDLDFVLGQMFWDFKPCLFFSREPCRPEGWPAQIKLHIPSLPSSSLETIAKLIRAYRSIESPVLTAGPDFVSMSSVLAVETLSKLFYLEDFSHEIEEQVTWIDPQRFATKIGEFFGPNNVTTESLASEGFQNRYKEFGVVAHDKNTNEELPIPRPFVRIIGFRPPAATPVLLTVEPSRIDVAKSQPQPLSPVMMDKGLFKTLLERPEGPKLDFKLQPYRLDNDRSKSEFIKDIISLANTNPPDEPSYIIIGIKDDPRELHGIDQEDLDDNTLQQLVKDKINRVPDFGYMSFDYEGKKFGVIKILPTRELCQSMRTIGVLRQHVIYTRKGSRNSEVMSSDNTDLVRERLQKFAFTEVAAEVA